MINNILKYRSEIMGVAIIWVLLYHLMSQASIVMLPYLSNIGYCGVDIFLFLSGIGLCYGYKKYRSCFSYFLKRFQRIYPTYLTVIAIASIGSFSLIEVIKESTGIGYYLQNADFSYYDWYIPTIFMFYLLFPLCHMFVNRDFHKWGGAILLLSLIPALLKLSGVNIPINNLTLSRFTIFVLGIELGVLNIKQIGIGKKWLQLLIIVAVIGTLVMCRIMSIKSHGWLWKTMMFWLPFIIITPGLTYILSKIIGALPNFLRTFLYFCGTLSLEIYLVHIFLMKPYILHFPLPTLMDNSIGRIGVGLIFIGISIAVAWLVNRFLMYLTLMTKNLFSRITVALHS